VAVGTPNMGEAGIPYCDNVVPSDDITGWFEAELYKYGCMVGEYIASCIDLLPLI